MAVEVTQTLEYKGSQLNAAPMLEVENFTNWKKSPDDEEDTRSNQEYLNDLEEEFHERTLLANSKRFFKKGSQRFSGAKETDETQATNVGGKKPELRPNKDFKAKYNKVKAKLEVSSDDNEMVEVKVFVDLVDDERVAVSKESAKNVQTRQKKPRLWDDVVQRANCEERPGSQLHTLRKKDLVFVKSLADDTNVSILSVERHWLSEAEGFNLPNHDTGRIIPAESQVKVTDYLVNVTDSSVTDYDSAKESSSVCSTSLPPLEKLASDEPVSGPKTIKSILKSNSTFKAKTLKGVTINEPTSALAKGNKNVSASKKNSAPAGKLKNVKTEDDIPLSVVMKELKDLKLQININQSSYSRNNNSQQCDIRKPIWYLDSGCSRHMTGVKSYLHKYVEQPGPKVLDEKKGVIFNSNKEVVMIAPKVRDIYVLDMTSLAKQSCFFAKASEHLNCYGIKDLLI
ncbi:hypothetical protein Tco_0722929 [Tanacetum coccineum]